MQISKWENPRKKDDVRLYVNKLLPYIEGRVVPKIWLEDVDGVATMRLKKTDKASVDEESACQIFRERLVAEGYIESDEVLLTWEKALGLVEKSSEKAKEQKKNNRVTGKTQYTKSQPTLIAQKAFQLDLTTISFDQPQTIVVDHRENPLLIELLKDHPSLQVKVESLVTGDIIIERRDGARIIIERKDCEKDIGQRTDFESSVIDDEKRLFNQSERMKLEPETIPIFLLEGDVYNNAQSMLVQAVDGALSYLMSIQSMNVVHTLNLPHTAYLVTKLARHFNEGLGYELSLRPKKPNELIDSKAFVLEGISGVSGSLSRELLAHFGSVKAVANAKLEDLVNVEGVGPKKALQIFHTLNEG